MYDMADMEYNRRMLPWHIIIAAVMALSCLGIAYDALAVTANSVVTAQTPTAPKVQVVNATGVVTLLATTNYVIVKTGAAAGSKINSVICTSNDTASHNIAYGIVRSATLYPLGVVAIGSASATSVIQVNLLSAANTPGLAVDSDGNPYLQLESTDALEVGVLTTAVTNTGGMAISCMATDGDF